MAWTDSLSFMYPLVLIDYHTLVIDALILRGLVDLTSGHGVDSSDPFKVFERPKQKL